MLWSFEPCVMKIMTFIRRTKNPVLSIDNEALLTLPEYFLKFLLFNKVNKIHK